MSDEYYQQKVWSDIKHKSINSEIQGLEGFDKNVIKINNQYAILIKYCSNETKPFFQFTNKEIDDLLKLEKIFPSKIFVVFTTGNKIACSISLIELATICNIRSHDRSVYFDDITYSGFVIKYASIEKPYKKNQYLDFLLQVK
jgi:hypothetical protein